MPSAATFESPQVESADDLVVLTKLDAPALMSLGESRREIISKVRSVLDQVGRFTFRRLDISLEDGRIVLRGTVRTWFQKQLAQHVVMQTPGLPPVVNALVVDPNRPIASVN